MIYVRRFLAVLFFIPRVLLAFCAFAVLWPFDIAVAMPVYYIMSGRFYWDDYRPLPIAAAEWLCGLGFKWKERI